MIPRQAETETRRLAEWFPVIAVTGPRQSGKTTLVRSVFPDLPYRSLEDPDVRSFAEDDPRGFLAWSGTHIILDEVQRVPNLLSYLQTIVDNDPEARVVLTGSQNFGLLESVTQSLAGRVGLLTLLPLSIAEIGTEGLRPKQFEEAALTGGYPRIYERNIPPSVFHANYFSTYIERDVRLLKNIGDLSTFQRFVRLCAGRAGQLLNLSTLAADAGIAVNTAKSWLSVLEAGYVVTLLTPYHRNFNKRLTKSPKIYFIDTGLACWLLGIETAEQLSRHHARGALFENLVVSELLKDRFNRGCPAGMYFWRDHRGIEVDCLIEQGASLQAVEIKSSATITRDLLDGLERWRAIAGDSVTASALVYAGDESQERSGIKIVPWWDAGRLAEGGER